MLLIALSASSQAIPGENFSKIDYADIKAKVIESPVHVRELINKLCAEDEPADMKMEDKIQAFYGQSYISNDGEEYFVFQMREALRKGDKEAALKSTDDILHINKLNLNALLTRANLIQQMMGDSAVSAKYSQKDVDHLNSVAKRVCEIIYSTGDGSAAYPYYVTKSNDEYDFINFYLKITDIKGAPQQIGNRDIFHLGTQSDMYKKNVIYFNVSRVQELEKDLQKQQNEIF